jgi:hypothetical protein
MKAASASFAVLAMFGLTALAQPPRQDPLEAAKASQRISEQKLEVEVRVAIENAEKLARSFPDKAVKQLKDAQTSVDLAVGIGNATRTNLTKSLEAKMAAVTGKAVVANPGLKLDPAGPIVKAKQDANREKYEVEVKAVRQGIEDVKKLQDSNQLTAANRLVAQLQAKYPNDVAVMMLAQKDNFANSVAMARDLNEQAQQRVNKALFQASEAALPAIRDVEFPKDWDKKKNRAGLNDVKLTDKEKKILEALEKEINLPGAKDKPLEYLLQEISTTMDIPLLIDKESLRALDIDLTKTGSLDARGISARTALRQLLAGQGLTYVIKSETIQIMTVEKARETLVARAYYLGDVVQGIGPFGGAATWGTFLDFQQTQANVQTVIDMIQDSVDPQSWKKRGGPGTITFHFPSMSIIVRASSEVHAALGSKLGSK